MTEREEKRKREKMESEKRVEPRERRAESREKKSEKNERKKGIKSERVWERERDTYIYRNNGERERGERERERGGKTDWDREMTQRQGGAERNRGKLLTEFSSCFCAAKPQQKPNRSTKIRQKLYSNSDTSKSDRHSDADNSDKIPTNSEAFR